MRPVSDNLDGLIYLWENLAHYYARWPFFLNGCRGFLRNAILTHDCAHACMDSKQRKGGLRGCLPPHLQKGPQTPMKNVGKLGQRLCLGAQKRHNRSEIKWLVAWVVWPIPIITFLYHLVKIKAVVEVHQLTISVNALYKSLFFWCKCILVALVFDDV